VGVRTANLAGSAKRTALERFDLQLSDGPVGPLQRRSNFSFKRLQVTRAGIWISRAIYAKGTPGSTVAQTVRVSCHDRVLEQGCVCQQQRDASCLVTFRALEQGKHTGVGSDNGLQRLLSDRIAEVLDLFEVGYDGIMLVCRIDRIEQRIQLGLRRGVPISLV